MALYLQAQGAAFSKERRLAMRLLKIALGIAVLAVAVLAATGVIYFRNTENDASVTIDKKELKEKTHEAIEKTREAGSEGLDRMGQALHKAGESMKGTSDERSAPDASAPAKSAGNGQADKADNNAPAVEKNNSPTAKEKPDK
jgi:hypothetical protein